MDSPERYDDLRRAFLQRLERYDTLSEEIVLEAIYDTVDAAMEYSLEFADDAKQLVQSRAPYCKINLSHYLREGKGVCWHMALAAAWLGGEAASRGLLSGRLTADVNQRKADNAAHEWARYTDRDGRVWILDIAQHYFGTLEASTTRKRIWNYFRPGEREDYMSRFGHLAKQQRYSGLGSVVRRVVQGRS